MHVTFDSVSELAQALRRAEAAHGQHEAQLGYRDPDWPTWYAQYMFGEQAGRPDQADLREQVGRLDEGKLEEHA
jgi:hypothetical protein